MLKVPTTTTVLTIPNRRQDGGWGAPYILSVQVYYMFYFIAPDTLILSSRIFSSSFT